MPVPSISAAPTPPEYTFGPIDQGAHTFTVTLRQLGSHSVTVTDAGGITGSRQGITVSQPGPAQTFCMEFPNSTEAGEQHDFTVQALAHYGFVAVDYAGTIHFSSSDPKATLPPDYTFLPGDRGTHSFRATFGTAGKHTLTITELTNISVSYTQTGIVVKPGQVQKLQVSRTDAELTAGGLGKVTVTAQDAFGNTAPDFTGTVRLSSSDVRAVLPAEYTFEASDKGKHDLEVTLRTVGPQTVTATVSNRFGEVPTGTTTFTVRPHHFVLDATTENAARLPFTVTVRPVDADGTPLFGYEGTVRFRSSDPTAVLPAEYTFTAQDGGSRTFTVNLRGEGHQTLTVQDAATASVKGEAEVKVTPAPNSRALSFDEQQAILAALEHLETLGVLAQVTSQLDARIPILERSLNDLIGAETAARVGDSLRARDAVRAYFDSGLTPTAEGVVQVLLRRSLGLVGDAATGNLPFGPVDVQVSVPGQRIRFDVAIDANVPVAVPLDLGEPGLSLGLAATGLINVDLGLEVNFSFGTDLMNARPGDPPPAEETWFWLDDLRVSASVHTTDLGLGLNVGSFRAVVVGGVVDLDAVARLSLADPGDNGDHRVTLAELAGTSLPALITPSTTGALSASLPVIGRFGDDYVTPSAPDVGQARVVITAPNLFVQAPAVRLEHLEEILDFRNVTPQALLDLLNGAGGGLEQAGAAIRALPIPFTDQTVGGVLDLVGKYAQGVVDGLTQVVDGAVVAVFGSTQELAERLAALPTLSSCSVRPHFDVATKTFTLQVELPIPIGGEFPLAFGDLGPLAGLRTDGLLDFTSVTTVRFTFGVELLRGLDGMFVQDFVVEGNATLSAEDLGVAGRLGLLDVVVGDGEVRGTASYRVAVQGPGGNARFHPLADQGRLVVTPRLSGLGHAEFTQIRADAGFVATPAGANPSVAIDVSNVGGGAPRVKVATRDLDRLLSFEHLGFSDVVRGLRKLADLLDDYPSFGLPAARLPLVERSIAELLDYAAPVSAAVDHFETSPAGAVQDLQRQLRMALGLPADSDHVNVSYDEAGQALRIGLTVDAQTRQALALDLDLSRLASATPHVTQTAPPLSAQLGNSSRASYVTSLSSTTGLSLPILTNPASLFGLLLGQDVDLVRFETPLFALDFLYTQVIPILPLLDGTITGRVTAGVRAAFGYDTFGLREAFASGNVGDVFDGFYVDTTRTQASLTASLGVGAAVNAIIARGGVEGGLVANVDLRMRDEDGKLRWKEIADTLARNPLCLFEVSGQVIARLFAYLEIAGAARQEVNLVPPRTVFTFPASCDRGANPDPQFPPPPPPRVEVPGSGVKLSSSVGTISNAQTFEPPVNQPPPAGVAFPSGFVSFQVGGLAPGGSTVVTVSLPPSDLGEPVVTNYYKFGPTPDNPTPHWYPFLYDGRTGARIRTETRRRVNGRNDVEFERITTITLFLVDGERGDDDLTANGVIQDPGGSTVRVAPTSRLLAVAGADSKVRVMRPDGTPVGQFYAFAPSFRGGVRLAVADFNGDGIDDVVAGAGPGAGPHVKVIDGTRLDRVAADGQIDDSALLLSFYAFDPAFAGGVFVAAGDVTGDGRADLVVGAGAGAVGGHVKVFDGVTFAEVGSYLTFAGYAGGVTVACGDVDGDGRADLVVGADAGGHVKVLNGLSGAELASFFAFAGFRGGVSVAAGDVDGDGRAEAFVAADGGVGGHVKQFGGAGLSERASFLAFEGFAGGARIDVTDRDGDGLADLAALAGAEGHVKEFDGQTLDLLDSLFAMLGA